MRCIVATGWNMMSRSSSKVEYWVWRHAEVAPSALQACLRPAAVRAVSLGCRLQAGLTFVPRSLKSASCSADRRGGNPQITARKPQSLLGLSSTAKVWEVACGLRCSAAVAVAAEVRCAPACLSQALLYFSLS